MVDSTKQERTEYQVTLKAVMHCHHTKMEVDFEQYTFGDDAADAAETVKRNFMCLFYKPTQAGIYIVEINAKPGTKIDILQEISAISLGDK